MCYRICLLSKIGFYTTKGNELLTAIHQQDPTVLKILLTGQASPDAVFRAVNQAKTAFLANMRHELRALDYDTNFTPKQSNSLRVVNQSSNHSLSLINDVLEMSKIEAGRHSLERSDFYIVYWKISTQ